VAETPKAPAAAGENTPEAAVAAQGASGAAAAAALVTNVEFEHRETSDWVKIEVSGYSSYEEEQQGIGRSRLVIRGARLSEALARTLDVRAFGGKLQNVAAAFDSARRAVVIEVEHDKQVRSMVSEQEERAHLTRR
jgi:hypothetical protein